MNVYSHGNITIKGNEYSFSLHRELEDDEIDVARPWLSMEEVAIIVGMLDEKGIIDTYELSVRVNGGDGKLSKEEEAYILESDELEEDICKKYEKAKEEEEKVKAQAEYEAELEAEKEGE